MLMHWENASGGLQIPPWLTDFCSSAGDETWSEYLQKNEATKEGNPWFHTNVPHEKSNPECNTKQRWLPFFYSTDEIKRSECQALNGMFSYGQNKVHDASAEIWSWGAAYDIEVFTQQNSFRQLAFHCHSAALYVSRVFAEVILVKKEKKIFERRARLLDLCRASQQTVRGDWSNPSVWILV